ncbi:MAG: D-apiose dehydrogenase [Baekduia sp.]|nr:D-apiose dehydrogenase [Baekduia sp.]
MLRAAVLGCGAIGAGAPSHPEVGVGSHAAAYVACPATELVAVADVDAGRARAAAERFGAAPAGTDVARLLAESEPELVSVCTPDATHGAVLELVLRAPSVRGVLAEKPLAAGAEEAAALVALARERDVVLSVNYSRRFAPPIVAVAGAVRGGALGTLQHVHGIYGKGLRHNGTHWLDLLRMLAGEPESVRGWDRLGESGDDPTLDAELTLGGGVGARLAALDHAAFTAFELDLIGTAGRIRLADAGHRIERFGLAADARHAGYRILSAEPAEHAGLRDALLHAVGDLARAVHAGGAPGAEPACTGADGVRALALAEAIAASAADGGRPVDTMAQPLQTPCR